MGIKELIKDTFIEGYALSTLSPMAIIVCIGCTCLLGIYIYIVYRHITRNTFYDRNFNISLMAIAVITAAIILTIQSNIIVSLGMVGALSIVRFRTAIKDPLDLIFLFWSIGVGIICGAGFSLIAIIMSITLTIIIYTVMNINAGSNTIVLVVNSSSWENEQEIMEIVERNCKYNRTRAKSVTRTGMNLAVEVRLEQEEKLIPELMALDSVISASLVEHEGEIVA
ncbi:MAG: DUF4956 domain-containing protein [Lachnospiraceae bacterium]|nr:DUF4956 domain-containing protein [Lachnospiraceae bacterium]